MNEESLSVWKLRWCVVIKKVRASNEMAWVDEV